MTRLSYFGPDTIFLRRRSVRLGCWGRAAGTGVEEKFPGLADGNLGGPGDVGMERLPGGRNALAM